MKRIRTALIGCGSIGVTHLQSALLVPEIKLSAVVDKDLEWAEKVGRKFGLNQICSEPDELFGKIDLVIIATPNYLHAPLSIKFLSRGVNVLCEKVMALSTEEAQEMISTSEKSGAKLAIGYNRRYRSSLKFMKRILEENWLGKVTEFEYQDGFVFTSSLTRTNYVIDRRLSGGGALIDFGVHGLDTIVWLLGEPEVASYKDDLQDENGIENNVELELKINEDIRGKMILSRTGFLKNTFTIKGTNGWVEMGSGDPLNLKIYKKDSKICSGLGPVKIKTSWRNTDFSDQLKNMADAIIQDRKPLVNGQEGIKSLRIVEECYKSKEIKKAEAHETLEAVEKYL
jgi:UDP-N-acetylglucosamine 3-dehydrogenase